MFGMIIAQIGIAGVRAIGARWEREDQRPDPRTRDYLSTGGGYGSVIPIVYGTRIVNAVLLQRGKVQVGGDPNATVSRMTDAYTWAVYGLVLGLTQGELGAIRRLWVDNVEFAEDKWKGAGLSLQGGYISGHAATAADDGKGGVWAVYNPGVAHLRGDPLDLVNLYAGSPLNPNQTTYQLLPEQVNSQPKFRVELTSGVRGPSLDCRPEAVIADIATRKVWWGAGWTRPFTRSENVVEMAHGTDGSLEAGFAAYAAANGWEVSVLIDQQTTIAAVLTEVAAACDAEVVPSEGKLKVYPRGEFPVGAYVPVTAAVCDIGYDDLQPQGDTWSPGEEPVSVEVAADKSTYNVVPVQFSNRAKRYEPDTTEEPEASDVGAIVNGKPRGERRSPVVPLPCIVSEEHAKTISGRLARRSVWQRARFRFRLPWRFGMLEPMDIVRITDPVLGVELLPLRILSVKEAANGKFSVEAEHWHGVVSGVTLHMSGAA